MMDDTIRKYFQEYLEFDKYLEFRIIDYSSTYPGGTRNVMFSRYASNIDEVEAIIKKYGNNPRFNVYVSSNTRPTKARTDSSVKLRRTFYIDVEAEGKKPPYSDEEYYTKLLETAKYIKDKLLIEGIKVNMLKQSGRGLHIGVKTMPMPSNNYENRFKIWFKHFIMKIEKDKPHKDIKFSDNMSNASRIESCPGTIHSKYSEQPFRKILFLSVHQNNMESILNQTWVMEKKKREIAPHARTKYDNNTIYFCPEFLLLKNHPNLPEGEIHNKIIAMLKCLVRDNNLDAEKMQMKLQELGYNEIIDTPHEDMVYSPWVLYNWCMRNYAYCFDNDVPLSYPLGPEGNYRINIIQITRVQYPFGGNIEDRAINTYRELIEFIREFNTKTAAWCGDKLAIYDEELKERVKEKCNTKLFGYIERHGLWEVIRGQFNEKPGVADSGLRRLF